MRKPLTRALGGLVAVALAYAAAPALLRSPIVVTQVPVRVMQTQAGVQPGEKSRIVLVDPDSTVRLLTPGFHSAADPEVSFDGKRLLFSGKRQSHDLWDIFEISVEGPELRQVTRNMGNCRNPLYLSKLNTLVSDKPWNQIAFLSDQGAGLNEYGTGTAFSLYSTNADGTVRLRLTYAPSGVMDPFLARDGRLLLSVLGRSRVDEPAHAAIFGLNIDGTDFALFAGGEGRGFKRMPCVTTGGLAVFVEQDRTSTDGAGYLSSVSLRRNHHSYRQITKPGEGLFLYPAPLRDGRILVSRRAGTDRDSYGACELDPLSGKVEKVFDDPAFHEIQAKVVAPRPEPDGRSTSVLRRTGEIEDPFALEQKGETKKTEEMPAGRLYGLNAYISKDIKAEWLPVGTVKRIRFLEGIPRSGQNSEGVRRPHLTPGRREAASEQVSARIQRRLLGEAPVEDDGSFNVQLPADVPIEIQMLDAEGMALQSCGWIWVKNNEMRGCIGCHEDPELVPENRLVKALTKPSVLLTLPAERRRSVDFVNHVRPIIQAKCFGCHSAGGSPPRLNDGTAEGAGGRLNRAFEILVAHKTSRVGGVRAGAYVTPGQARTSPLIWHILGRNTSRPWDRGEAGSKAAAPGSPSLNEDEKRVFIEWIDMGAQWSIGSARTKAPLRK